MKITVFRTMAAVWIGFGLLVFLAAAGLVGHMYINLDFGASAGPTLVPVFMLFSTYVFLTFCNFTGGIALFFSSKDSKSPISAGIKAVVLLGCVAQILPIVYAIFFSSWVTALPLLSPVKMA